MGGTTLMKIYLVYFLEEGKDRYSQEVGDLMAPHAFQETWPAKLRHNHNGHLR